ncbi:hypothetical protein BD410DRAFT_783841 [Rickenella mellea]|uniref:BAH-domain-containing protein n=1 Tax=Rickenella mellea TaxID=50990 RepID=A0A4Y7QHA0_9AGAM|nr:hypothetical protein BD410DRAFT_783841 [Rickenella mellea]
MVGETQSVTLKNGVSVKVNDHVYCSPSWTVRDGTPYSVARVMEFLPPEGSSSGKGKGKEGSMRVRLAWYYRPSDVSDRSVSDSRLLLAAIYSEVCDINQLRAKCYVMHKDKLTDLSGWKKRPDHFYFHRLFDPYIKKEFEVLLSTDVRNLPVHIKEVLVSRYEYIVAEKEVVPDLMDHIRLCETCVQWCPNNDSVQCDRCKKYFHMNCVNPPLMAKPSRGYGWTCAPCSRRHEDQVDSGHIRSVTPVTSKPLPKTTTGVTRGRGRPRKDKGINAKIDDELTVKHYKLWPFRYFGLFTVAEDTLDPNDLIFPRAATRIGPKFQASTGAGPDKLPGDPMQADERGGDATVAIQSVVSRMSEKEVEKLEKHKSNMAQRKDLLWNVEWLTEAIRRMSQAYADNNGDFSSVNMQSVWRLEPFQEGKRAPISVRYMDIEWRDDEISAFEDGIAQFGAELRSVKWEIPSRTLPEVVRFYGKWKNARLREENVRLKEKAEANGVKPERPQTPAPSQSFMSDDEGSIVKFPTKANSHCAACRTRESKVWWKAPKGLPTNILCDNCGMNWRKYADLNARPLRDDAPPASKTRAAEKREGTPLTTPPAKRAKTTGVTSAAATPPPVPAPTVPTAQVRCTSCYKLGPLGKVLKCQECSFLIHAGANGAVVEPDEVGSWVCELCQNEKTLEASLNSDCLLCPRQRRDPVFKRDNKYPPPDSYLRACKPTEGQGWVHVLCSVFIPEVSFADSSRLRLVEGVSTIPKHRWTSLCTLCGESGGAVVRCGNCPKEYHVSCAWKFGHKFGFEIQPVKSTRRDITSVIHFKKEIGAMTAVICCKEHSSYRRDLYDICETNEAGETALQVYCRAYKQAQISQSHALLRKARRLDNILNVSHTDGSHHVSEEPIAAGEPSCNVCHTEFSPFFYPLEGENTNDSTAWLCHRCHFPDGNTH